MNLSLQTVQVDALAPTGTACVTLDGSGLPHFHFQDDAAWDCLAVTAPVLEIVEKANAICFGTLAQRNAVSRAAIQRMLAAARSDSLRIFDVNLRCNYYSRKIIEQSLGLANVLKLNRDELVIFAEMFSIDGPPQSQILRLAEMFQQKIVALTRGEKGSLIYAEGTWSERLPLPTPVVDTVGAGDSFTAALAMGLLARMPLEEIHTFASDVATFVCSRPGATPILPQAFLNKWQASVNGAAASSVQVPASK